MASERIAPVDAARGCAMIAVCVSHINQHFSDSAPQLQGMLIATTRFATPTFLLLSGFVIGHLLRTSARNVAPMLVDRGLFLLFIGHLLLGLAMLPQMHVTQWLFGRTTIIDAIAVALFAAVLLRRAGAATLLTIGGALCLLSWGVAMAHDAALLEIEPPIIVPYIGVFLMGMALSVLFEQPLCARHYGVIARRLTWLGGTAVVLVATGFVAWQVATDQLSWVMRDPRAADALYETLNPLGKRPPSPAYLFFYGGLGLLLLAKLFEGRPAWLVQPVIHSAEVIGRASLMSYIVQDWLFFLLPKMLGYDEVTSVPFWLAYVTISVLFLYALALKWNHLGGNRLFTVGLKTLWRKRSVKR
jgi:uncharacterized membrane protein